MGEKLCINVCFGRLEDDEQVGVLENGLALFSDWIGSPFESAITVFEPSDFRRAPWSGVRAALTDGVPDGKLLQIYTSGGDFKAGLVALENDDSISFVRFSIPNELILTLPLNVIEARCLNSARELSVGRTSVLAGMELVVESHGTVEETVVTELKGKSLTALGVVPIDLTQEIPQEYSVLPTADGLAILRHVHAAQRLHLA
jgi:hypothetical protein